MTVHRVHLHLADLQLQLEPLHVQLFVAEQSTAIVLHFLYLYQPITHYYTTTAYVSIYAETFTRTRIHSCGRSTWVPRRNPAAKRSHTGAETLTHPQYARRPSSRTVRMKPKSRRLPLCCHYPHETRQFSLSWCCVVYLAPLRPRHRRRYCR